MKRRGVLSRQLTDLLAYVLVPLFSLLVPAAFSRRVLRRVSNWHWLLAAPAEAALEGALKHLVVEDEERFRRRWKQVEMLDARDLYMMLFGRVKSVLCEIDIPADFETARNRVMVGMHWGPAISILKLLAVSGMRPAFPYRPPERQLLGSRPFYYLFSRLAALYLSRTLADRAVPVGGASKILQGMLDVPGSICVLMDAPPMLGRPAISRPVLGSAARFNAGFPAILAEMDKEYVLYAVNLLDDGSARKKLELAGPFRSDSAEEFLGNYAAFLDKHLAKDAPLWRIWHAEHQFWGETT